MSETGLSRPCTGRAENDPRDVDRRMGVEQTEDRRTASDFYIV
jgi:hypothetical protein